MKLVNEVSSDQWNHFLQECDQATIYHTPEWKKLLEASFNYEPCYLFVLDENNQLIGLLPLFKVRSRITRNRLCTLPFSHECGYIGDENAMGLVYEEVLRLGASKDISYIEIRDRVNMEAPMEVSNTYCKHVIELSDDLDRTWRNLDRSVRANIKKTVKDGVTTEVSRDMNDIYSYYELDSVSKIRHGVPCHPLTFLKNMHTYMQDKLILVMARYQNKVVSGGVRWIFKDQMVAAYASSDPDYRSLSPQHAVDWASIVYAHEIGCKIIDYGRTSKENRGLIGYKKRYGTIEKEMYYSYYPQGSWLDICK